MNIKYRSFEDSDQEMLTELILNLYKEDSSVKLMTTEKIRKTFNAFRSHPEKGIIVVIESDGVIAGYSILINFWSNEFGGNILFIDELYIKKEFRGQSIATDFIKYISQNKSEGTIALQLQVTPGNVNARKLYERLGFGLHKNDTLLLEL